MWKLFMKFGGKAHKLPTLMFNKNAFARAASCPVELLTNFISLLECFTSEKSTPNYKD